VTHEALMVFMQKYDLSSETPSRRVKILLVTRQPEIRQTFEDTTSPEIVMEVFADLYSALLDFHRVNPLVIVLDVSVAHADADALRTALAHKAGAESVRVKEIHWHKTPEDDRVVNHSSVRRLLDSLTKASLD
jgi:hypothetical protein